MKANLALFVADFAAALGLADWNLEPNPDANGGRVMVIDGDLVAGDHGRAETGDKKRHKRIGRHFDQA